MRTALSATGAAGLRYQAGFIAPDGNKAEPMSQYLIEECTGIVINFHGLNCESRDLALVALRMRGLAKGVVHPASWNLPLFSSSWENMIFDQTLLPRLPPFPLIES